jgi:hypothetical protein
VTQNPQFSGAADCLQGHYVMQALLTPFNTETNCYEEITHQQNKSLKTKTQHVEHKSELPADLAVNTLLPLLLKCSL